MTKDKEKLLWMAESKRIQDESIEAANARIDSYIRSKKITPYMASSLINDTHYKNEILQNFFKISEVVYDQTALSADITANQEELQFVNDGFDNMFWISNKQYTKAMKKIRNKKIKLEQKLLSKSSTEEKILLIKDRIKTIDYLLWK